MKRIIIIAVAMIAFYSCTKEGSMGNMPEIKITIPDVLKENREADSYIRISTREVNEWSEKLNLLYDDCQVYAGKEESEMTLDEKQKLGKAMMEYMAGIGQFTVKMAEIENNGNSLLAKFNEVEASALKSILDIYHSRIAEINRQYELLSQAEN